MLFCRTDPSVERNTHQALRTSALDQVQIILSGTAIDCSFSAALLACGKWSKSPPRGRRLAPALPQQEHHLITVIFIYGSPEPLAVQLWAWDDVRQAEICRRGQEGICREVSGTEVSDEVVCDAADGHADGFPAQSSGTAVVSYDAGTTIST